MFGLGGQEIVFVLILVVLYFIPSFIAKSRNHNNKGAIIALNILLGWTFIGWVVALVWALTNNKTS